MKKALFAAAAVGAMIILAINVSANANATEPYHYCEKVTVDKWHPCPSPSTSMTISPSVSPSASKSASTSPSPSSSPSTSVVTSATSGPTATISPAPVGQLPVTGSKIWVVVGSGALLVAAGIAVLLVARKRSDTKFIAE